MPAAEPSRVDIPVKCLPRASSVPGSLGYDSAAVPPDRRPGNRKRRPVAANPSGEEKSPAHEPGSHPCPDRGDRGLWRSSSSPSLVIVFSGGGGHKYKLVFQNASQLVPDNQVLIGGQPVGSVESIEPHRRQPGRDRSQRRTGTARGDDRDRSAPPRSPASPTTTSRSAPGPNSNPPLDDGATLGLASTTTPVDLDQLFNTFPRARSARRSASSSRATRDGTPAAATARPTTPSNTSAPASTGPAPSPANSTPTSGCSRSFVVSSSKLSTASPSAAPAALQRDLQRQHRLQRDRQPERRPSTRRSSCCRRSSARANTTFVNLRAALDDLDPLVETAKPATKNLAPFLRRTAPGPDQSACRSSATSASPSRRPGFANDSRRTAGGAAGRPAARLEGLPALRRGDRSLPAEPQLPPRLHARPLQRLRPLGQVTGNYDGNGHYARVSFSRPQPLQLQHRQRACSNRSRRANSTTRSAPRRRRPRPLPGRRHPARRRRLQPVRRTALRRRRRQLLRMQPDRRAPRTMRKSRQKTLIGGRGRRRDRRPDRPHLRRRLRKRVPRAGGLRQRLVHGQGRGSPRRRRQRRQDRVGRRHPCPAKSASYENGKLVEDPGKAVIVMKIDDPGFQDFRSDASCMIRPQSLIGEKFVDCRPTLPRAPGSEAAAAAERGPRRRARAPASTCCRSSNNSTSVDPDLINDINRLPYAQRFRLILNELGAGLAGRGEDLEDRGQARQPGPARRRPPASGSSPPSATSWPSSPPTPSRSSGRSRRAARPRRRLPLQLRRRRRGQRRTRRGTGSLAAEAPRLPAPSSATTMRSLQGFSDAATPVFADLDRAAPSLTEATRALTPFSPPRPSR